MERKEKQSPWLLNPKIFYIGNFVDGDFDQKSIVEEH